MSMTEAICDRPLRWRTDDLPAVGADRLVVTAPIAAVTAHEDRARVHRTVRLTIGPGITRLAVADVAPVLEDASLHAEVDAPDAYISTIAVRRVMRVRTADGDDRAGVLEAHIRELERRHRATGAQRARDGRRYRAVTALLQLAVEALPRGWADAPEDLTPPLEALFERTRTLRDTVLANHEAQDDIRRAMNELVAARRALDESMASIGARIELDIVRPECAPPVEVELDIRYTVPNVIWRSLHRAEWFGDRVVFSVGAALWQHTGEDWTDVRLELTTERDTSLVAPPPVEALRATTTVAVSAGAFNPSPLDVLRAPNRRPTPTLYGAGDHDSAIEPPAPDDGGEVFEAVIAGSITVPSGPSPTRVVIETFEVDAVASSVLFAEVQPVVMRLVEVPHAGAHVLLAGPVERFIGGAAHGATRLMRRCPRDTLRMSFGATPSVRVSRSVHETNHVDDAGWRHVDNEVSVHLNNLDDVAQVIDVTERVPVSILDGVRIDVDRDRSTGRPVVDDRGMCRTRVTVPAHGRTRVELRWRLSVAPGVDDD